MLKSNINPKLLKHEDHFSRELYYPGSWIFNMPVHAVRSVGDKSVLNDVLTNSKQNYFHIKLDPGQQI